MRDAADAAVQLSEIVLYGADGAPLTDLLMCEPSNCAAPTYQAGRFARGCSGHTAENPHGCKMGCDNGFYVSSSHAGDITCEAEAGSNFVSYAHQPECAPCPPEHYSNADTISMATGDAECRRWKNCPAGSGRVDGSGSNEENLECEPCIPGNSFNAYDDISPCDDLPACPVGSGLYGNNDEEAGQCQDCLPGTYSDTAAAEPCEGIEAECPANGEHCHHSVTGICEKADDGTYCQCSDGFTETQTLTDRKSVV